MLHYVTVGPKFTRAPADEPTRSWVLDAADAEAAMSEAASVYQSLHPGVGSLRVRATSKIELASRLQFGDGVESQARIAI
jgi:hypothetical protein